MRAAPPIEEAHEARAGSLAPLDISAEIIFIKKWYLSHGSRSRSGPKNTTKHHLIRQEKKE